ncbi:MAG: OsmC family protein [Vulcanimicrobiaceae bacterium]
MTGTFGGALSARRIDAGPDKLTANVTGEIELEDGVLVIRRIRVDFTLKGSEDMRAVVERAHGVFADQCPLHRTLKRAVEITSTVNIVP